MVGKRTVSSADTHFIRIMCVVLFINIQVIVDLSKHKIKMEKMKEERNRNDIEEAFILFSSKIEIYQIIRGGGRGVSTHLHNTSFWVDVIVGSLGFVPINV